MSDIHIPSEFITPIDGVEWYMLAKTMAWLKGIDGSVQVNQYKNRCSACNIKRFKSDEEKGKPRIYVNRDGLTEIVERTPSVKLSYKRLMGVSSGVTRSEHVFGCLLEGFFDEIGLSVDRQVALDDYRIDFVIDGVVAVEYDELDHASYNKKREAIRERDILRKYRLVRVSESENEGAAIARIAKKMKAIHKS